MEIIESFLVYGVMAIACFTVLMALAVIGCMIYEAIVEW